MAITKQTTSTQSSFSKMHKAFSFLEEQEVALENKKIVAQKHAEEQRKREDEQRLAEFYRIEQEKKIARSFSHLVDIVHDIITFADSNEFATRMIEGTNNKFIIAIKKKSTYHPIALATVTLPSTVECIDLQDNTLLVKYARNGSKQIIPELERVCSIPGMMLPTATVSTTNDFEDAFCKLFRRYLPAPKPTTVSTPQTPKSQTEDSWSVTKPKSAPKPRGQRQQPSIDIKKNDHVVRNLSVTFDLVAEDQFPALSGSRRV